MSELIRIDDTNCRDSLSAAQWDASRERITSAADTLHGKNGAGSDFLGWMTLPGEAREQLQRLENTAAAMRAQSDVIVVIGIGGSYLGARAVIESLRQPFGNEGPEIVYAGNHIDGAYLQSLLRYLENRSVSINVISKSGTTTEPALAFRVLRQMMEERYGHEEAARRIVATTDASRGALRKVADEQGYQSFIIPDDVGGRFSVFTPVGLLPIAAAGMDIRALLDGAATMQETAATMRGEEHPAFHYALLRDAMYRSDHYVEVLASFHPALQYVTEWWKQLFGESEGKDGKGIFPAAVTNTTDLHSMGQYIQDGRRMLFETFLFSTEEHDGLRVPEDADNTDGLNYLAGSSFAEVNRNAMQGTALAHRSGGVPNASILMDGITSRSIGALLYFFEYTVALSGYALDVNPFDQPGVEEYKRNMFALLNKPGFEELRTQLLSKLKSTN
ncbi:glucose-6-phosphate isomerase [bacterium]|nr:glucose-6-phosphate isomerase [bacterium]